MTQVIRVRAGIKDHWSNWTRDYIPAPIFNVSEYQKRLDEIAGTSRGESIIKLEWGGDAQITKFSHWDEHGNPIASEVVPKFAIPRVNPLMAYLEYIPIRRWVLTQRQEPEQLRPDDDSDNTFTDEYGKTCKVAEKPKALYTPYIYIGDHSFCKKDCCEKRICLGDYKNPGLPELNLVLEHTYYQRQEFNINPYATLTQADVDKIRRESIEKRKEASDKFDKDFDEASKHEWTTMRHMIFTESPKTRRHGKYSIFKDGKPL